MCEETNYPVLIYYVDYDYSYEVPGDYFYTYGVEQQGHDDFVVEIDLNEEPYCDWYEEGMSEIDILAEVLYKDYTYGDTNKWDIFDKDRKYITTIVD